MRKLVENNDPSRLTKIRMRGKVIYVEYGDKEIYLLIDTYLDTKEIGIFTFIFPGNTITWLYTNIKISQFSVKYTDVGKSRRQNYIVREPYFECESTLYGCLNVKELLAQNNLKFNN